MDLRAPGRLHRETSTPTKTAPVTKLPIPSSNRSTTLRRALERVRDGSNPPRYVEYGPEPTFSLDNTCSSSRPHTSFVDLTNALHSRRTSCSTIALDDDDVDDADDVEYLLEVRAEGDGAEDEGDEIWELDDIAEPIDRSQREAAVPASIPKRNAKPEPPFVEIESCRLDAIVIKPGKTVELHDGDFLRVTSILQDVQEDGRYRLRGWRFRRTNMLAGRLLKMRNEVCMILKVDRDDPRDPLEQGVEEVDFSEAVRPRRLLMTNRDPPALTYYENNPNDKLLSDDVVYDLCNLVCRWKKIYYYPNAVWRFKERESEVVISKIREHELGLASPVPESSRVSDTELRRIWRGETVKGGRGAQFEVSEQFQLLDPWLIRVCPAGYSET